MHLDEVKEKLVHLKHISCDDNNQKAIKAMLEALELESDWTETELQELLIELDALVNELT